MSDLTWTLLYAATCVLAVVPLARFHRATIAKTARGAMACGLIVAYAWPLYALVGVGYLIAKYVGPLVIRQPDEDPADDS